MKNVLLIAILALGVALMTFGKTSAGTPPPPPSYEYAGGALYYNGIDTPFSGLGKFIIDGVHDAFGDGLFRSMFATFVGESMGNSMNSGLSMYGGKMSALPGNLSQEFLALGLRTGNESLINQVASGSSQTWVSISSSELTTLGLDPSLAQMAGF